MSVPEPTLDRLRATLAIIRSLPSDEKDEVAGIIAARDQVMATYRPVFSPGAVARLDKEVFRGFLLFKNNRHWSDLQRHGGVIGTWVDFGRSRRSFGRKECR